MRAKRTNLAKQRRKTNCHYRPRRCFNTKPSLGWTLQQTHKDDNDHHTTGKEAYKSRNEWMNKWEKEQTKGNEKKQQYNTKWTHKRMIELMCNVLNYTRTEFTTSIKKSSPWIRTNGSIKWDGWMFQFFMLHSTIFHWCYTATAKHPHTFTRGQSANVCMWVCLCVGFSRYFK